MKKINFLLILCEFHIMILVPTHLPVPSNLSSALAYSFTPQKNKIKFKRRKKEEEKNLIAEARVWHSESDSTPFSPLLASVHCSESLVLFKASGFCHTIDFGPHWDSSWIDSYCLVSWWSDSCEYARLAPSHASADQRWDGCWGGQLITTVLGLGGCWVG